MGSGLLVTRTDSKIIDNIVILLITISFFILSDRLLLVKSNLPLWMWDAETHYQHRPNTLRTWGPEYENKPIRINKYGHHDDDFPIRKSQNEFRGIILGDSIVMGHGMTYEETFSNQLEAILKIKDTNHGSFQIINTGVQGYSIFQEYHILQRSLVFKPDFVAIGFCMNDVTEPFVVNREFGGVGVDYHGIEQASSRLIGYIMNETGYGRLIQKLKSRNKSIAREKKTELFNVEYAASHSQDDPNLAKAWNIVLSYLEKIYDLTKKEKIKPVLLIFPFTFQFMHDDVKIPQQILRDHAKRKNVDVIDFTTIFEKIIFEENVVDFLRENKFSYDEIYGLFKIRIDKYFLDADHLTIAGHKIVAARLFEYLDKHVLTSKAPTLHE